MEWRADNNGMFIPPGNKFTIGTLHGALVEISAQYNPKELARTAAATWTPHPNTSAKNPNSKADNHLWMEYGTTTPRSLTFELVFDGYEETQSVDELVRSLESLTLPVDMSSKRTSDRRPQACVAVWGAQSFRCVVTSVATKLTMFSPLGKPLRAICSVTLTECDVVAMMKADGGNTDVDFYKARQASIARFGRARAPTPVAPNTETVNGTSTMSGGTYQTGTPTEDRSHQVIGKDDDAKPAPAKVWGPNDLA
jgi:hypothetical protein